MEKIACPRCGSENVTPAEREYKDEDSFWTVLIAVFFLFVAFFLLFFFLQLHPVIMILLGVAAVSRLLHMKSSSRKKQTKIEYICLECNHRFTRTEK